MIAPYFHLTQNILRSNFKRLNLPYKLTFAVTYRCNSRCTTCNIWKKKASRELSLEEIDRFFNNTPDFSWIDLTGGEPSLRRDFADICETISRRCKKLLLLHFPTNGLLTDKIVSDVQRIRSLGSSFKIIITVSTDGYESLNDKIRGIPGAWKKQLETFRQLRTIPNVETVIGMTLSPDNCDQFQQTYASIKEAAPSFSPRDFHISLLNFSGTYYDNLELKDLHRGSPEKHARAVQKMLRSTSQYRRMIGRHLTPRALLERSYLKYSERFLVDNITPLPCHALRSSCFIDPTGEVYPCITYDRSLGNLKDVNYDLKRIWQDAGTKKLQQEIQSFNCPQCWTGCDGYQTILGNLLRPLKRVKPGNISS